tara:strand:+ start:3524 stop:5086 length:1563 start_codon:yes stop_codon:yes gene_type:complete
MSMDKHLTLIEKTRNTTYVNLRKIGTTQTDTAETIINFQNPILPRARDYVVGVVRFRASLSAIPMIDAEPNTLEYVTNTTFGMDGANRWAYRIWCVGADNVDLPNTSPSGDWQETADWGGYTVVGTGSYSKQYVHPLPLCYTLADIIQALNENSTTGKTGGWMTFENGLITSTENPFGNLHFQLQGDGRIKMTWTGVDRAFDATSRYQGEAPTGATTIPDGLVFIEFHPLIGQLLNIDEMAIRYKRRVYAKTTNGIETLPFCFGSDQWVPFNLPEGVTYGSAIDASTGNTLAGVAATSVIPVAYKTATGVPLSATTGVDIQPFITATTILNRVDQLAFVRVLTKGDYSIQSEYAQGFEVSTLTDFHVDYIGDHSVSFNQIRTNVTTKSTDPNTSVMPVTYTGDFSCLPRTDLRYYADGKNMRLLGMYGDQQVMRVGVDIRYVIRYYDWQAKTFALSSGLELPLLPGEMFEMKLAFIQKSIENPMTEESVARARDLMNVPPVSISRVIPEPQYELDYGYMR